MDLDIALHMVRFMVNQTIKEEDMKCYNDNCHSHNENHICSIPHLFADRPCYERILPPEPAEESEK